MPRHGRLIAGCIAARGVSAWLVTCFGLRNLLDLPGDRIQPLVNVRDLAAFLAGHRRPLIVGRTKAGRGGIADGGIEPIAQRHAGPARGGLGPFPDGWIDAFITPRYARIHALGPVQDFGAPPAPSASPRVPSGDNRIPRRSSASDPDFFALR